MAETQPDPGARDLDPEQRVSPVSPVMVLAGAGSVALDGALQVARGAVSVLHPVAEAVPTRLRPARVLRALARRGEQQRRAVLAGTARLLDLVVPVVLDEVLRRVDLTAKVTQYVDVDRLAAAVDLNAAAERIDVNAVASRVDLDLAASRIDVDAVASRVDLDAIVRRLDLIGIAEEVIAAIDLPEIIRDSTGSIASDTVHGTRMQAIAADEAVARVRHRLWTRRPRETGEDQVQSSPRQPVSPTPPAHGASG